MPNAHGTTPFLLAVAVNALSIVRYLHQWATSSKRKDPSVLQRMLHATDHEALEAFKLLAATEGILPALEPAHALAHVARIAGGLPKDHLMVVNLSGRGDKDIFTVADALGTRIA